jgi:hypothetical protein
LVGKNAIIFVNLPAKVTGWLSTEHALVNWYVVIYFNVIVIIVNIILTLGV